MNKLGLK